MSKMKFEHNLEIHLEADVRAIYVESSEWMRLHKTINNCCKKLNKKVWVWNKLEGLYFASDRTRISETEDPMLMLEFLRKEKTSEEKGVYILDFADFYLRDEDIAVAFAITLQAESLKGSHIIVLAPTLDIPNFLKNEFSVLDFPLPEREEIRGLLGSIEIEFGISKKVDYANEILDSVRGLGTTEIRNAFAKAAVTHKKITAEQIRELVAEKEQIIRKKGYLKFISPDSEMNLIGGLENLLEWLRERKKSFGEQARKAKLNSPKGVLLLGIPGTGKSLCARVAAAEWEIPLLRLDMGSIFSSGVGDSEANMRDAIKVAESLAPCVLWIDEIEKGLSGGASQSGELDGGTSVRVFGSFLTWMQEKDKDVFVFATANKIEKLPAEFLRKGRFDEIFFVDLPGKEARKSIFENHLKKKGQNVNIPDDLLNDTNGFSGAEIEYVVNEALFKSYNSKDGMAAITVQNLIDAVKGKGKGKGIVPLSSTMPEYINGLRKLADDRYRPAANEDAPEISPRKSGARLPSEKIDYFQIKKNHD